jgi:glutaryl-CoA dehydrogenase
MELDLYQIENLLSEDEILARNSIGSWVNDQVLPKITECFRNSRFPSELIPEMAELGLFGINLQGYGCAGLGDVTYGLVMKELERGDSAIRSFASVQSSLVMYPIYTYGSEEQKQKWLPKLAKGELIGCFGLTEPDFGSDPNGMLTRAKQTSEGWLLNGSKMWITNGEIADLAIVWAKSENDIIGLIVEKGTQGFSTSGVGHKFSLRASVTSQLIFDDCLIPAENRLQNAAGLKAALSCLSQARYGIAWGALGALDAIISCALDYSKSRIQFGKPIASFQLIQQKLVDMWSEYIKGYLLALQLGRLKEQGKATPAMISMAKRNNVRMALEAARSARNMLGANGITDEYPIIRHMLNLESVDTYEGTYNIHTLILGQKLTEISSFI